MICQVRCRIPLDLDSIQNALCHGKEDLSAILKEIDLDLLKHHCYLHLYRTVEDDKEHIAIVFGDYLKSRSLEAVRDGETRLDRRIRGADMPYEGRALRTPIVRIHSACFTGEIVGSIRCDCGEQLKKAIAVISANGHGVIIYLNQEGRGIGLLEKLKAYNLQDMGHDTISANIALGHPADKRTYDAASEILRDLGISELILLTNNPEKIAALQRSMFFIKERIEMVPKRWRSEVKLSDAALWSIPSELDKYLLTKIKEMDHLITIPNALNPVDNTF